MKGPIVCPVIGVDESGNLSNEEGQLKGSRVM